MWNIERAYIDRVFATVQGKEIVQVFNPATEELAAIAKRSNRDDAKRAISATGRAQKALRHAGKAERIEMLEHLPAAVLARTEKIRNHRGIRRPAGTRNG